LTTLLDETGNGATEIALNRREWGIRRILARKETTDLEIVNWRKRSKKRRIKHEKPREDGSGKLNTWLVPMLCHHFQDSGKTEKSKEGRGKTKNVVRQRQNFGYHLEVKIIRCLRGGGRERTLETSNKNHRNRQLK